MGLFDYFLDQSSIEWQTKSFSSPNLERYRVNESGYLEKRSPPEPKLAGRYMDYAEAYASFESLSKDKFEWSWAMHDFSGIVHALISDPDSELLEAEFEFRSGRLIRVDMPGLT